MKLEEAIEILEKAVEAIDFIPDHPLRHAQKLSIEALKREEKRRRFAIPDKVDLLPGETKEE